MLQVLAKQDSPEVHANAAEILCAVTRCAPPSLATKICSPRYSNFIFWQHDESLFSFFPIQFFWELFCQGAKYVSWVVY
jgi:hypothetical protein